MFRRFERPKHKGERGEVLPDPHEGLPDTSSQGGLCPRCGKQSSFEYAGSLPVTADETFALNRDGTQELQLLDRVSSLICRHCGHGVVVIEEKWIGEHPAREGTKGGGTLQFRGIYWWPLPDTKLSADIPSEIAGAFAEAITALYAKCPRASAVMARRTLEAITIDKGETTGTLAGRLQALAAKGVLHPTLVDWTREVRLVGNSGAHYDVINQVSIDDAQQLINFVRELLRYLYELPADLVRRRGNQP